MFITKILKLLLVLSIGIFIIFAFNFQHEPFIPDISIINKTLDHIDDDQKDVIIKGVQNEISKIQSNAHNLVDSWAPCILKMKSCDKKIENEISTKKNGKNLDTYAIVPPITTDIVIPRDIPVIKSENNDIVFYKN